MGNAQQQSVSDETQRTDEEEEENAEVEVEEDIEELEILISAAKSQGLKSLSSGTQKFISKMGVTQEIALTKCCVAMAELATEFAISGHGMDPSHNFCRLGACDSLLEMLHVSRMSTKKNKYSTKRKNMVSSIFRAISQIAKLEQQQQALVDIGLIGEIVATLNQIVDVTVKKNSKRKNKKSKDKSEKDNQQIKIFIPSPVAIEKIIFWGMNALYFLIMEGTTMNDYATTILMNVEGNELIQKLKLLVGKHDASLLVHINLIDQILLIGRKENMKKWPRNDMLHVNEMVEFNAH